MNGKNIIIGGANVADQNTVTAVKVISRIQELPMKPWFKGTCTQYVNSLGNNPLKYNRLRNDCNHEKINKEL